MIVLVVYLKFKTKQISPTLPKLVSLVGEAGLICSGAHRSMDRTLACEAENLGSTPNGRTKYHFKKVVFLF